MILIAVFIIPRPSLSYKGAEKSGDCLQKFLFYYDKQGLILAEARWTIHCILQI